MSKFFRKELCANPFYVNGVVVPFECFPSNSGVIALDEGNDSVLIMALDDAAAKRKGGIVAIDQAAYDELKKNKGGLKVSAAFLKAEPLRVMKPLAPLKPSPKASADVKPPMPSHVLTPATARVTRDKFKPATARVAPSASTVQSPAS